MSEHQSLVSVLMTAFNRSNYIGDSIESVLSSSYTNFELIIVDDCSQDNTVEIAQKYAISDSRIRVYTNEKNLGDYPNRNKAASYAQGKYIKYLDSDDIIYKHGLQVMIECMEAFPNAGYGLCANFDVNRPYPVELDPVSTYKEHFYTPFQHFNRAPGSSIIRKEAFDRVGGFSGQRMIGDMEMWFRLSRYFSMVKMPVGLVWNRSHEGQESQSEYAKRYSALTKKVIYDALVAQDCPLSEKDRRDLWRFLYKESIKGKIQRFISLK